MNTGSRPYRHRSTCTKGTYARQFKGKLVQINANKNVKFLKEINANCNDDKGKSKSEQNQIAPFVRYKDIKAPQQSENEEELEIKIHQTEKNNVNVFKLSAQTKGEKVGNSRCLERKSQGALQILHHVLFVILLQAACILGYTIS